MNLRHAVASILAIGLFASCLKSQTEGTLFPIKSSAARDTTWEITMRSGHSLTEITLDSLTQSTLFISKHGATDSVDVAEIAQLRNHRSSTIGSSTLVGIGVGTAFGLAMGALINTVEGEWGSGRKDDRPKIPGVIMLIMGGLGTVSGTLLGFVAGLAHGIDIVIDLEDEPLPAALDEIEGLFLGYQD